MIKAVLLAAIVGYLTLAALAYFTADRQIFLPPRSSYGRHDLPVIMIPAGDGVEIAALHLPNDEAAFTILYAHGNAEDLGHLAPMLEEIRDAGFAVLAWDYRGYGLSTGGPPTAAGATEDVDAVYRHATTAMGIDPRRIIAYGRSVGSGPAVHLAARAPVGGLVVESGFTTAFRVVTRVQLLPFDRFPNVREIRRAGCPVLIIHGLADSIIPPWHGRELFEAAPEPKRALWIRGAGHNDLYAVAREEYLRGLREFRALLEPRGDV